MLHFHTVGNVKLRLVRLLLSLLSGLFSHSRHALDHANAPFKQVNEPANDSSGIISTPSTCRFHIYFFDAA